MSLCPIELHDKLAVVFQVLTSKSLGEYREYIQGACAHFKALGNLMRVLKRLKQPIALQAIPKVTGSD